LTGGIMKRLYKAIFEQKSASLTTTFDVYVIAEKEIEAEFKALEFISKKSFEAKFKKIEIIAAEEENIKEALVI